ncbi:unnamed protein product [Dibothriocephalus latus]|uniref:glutathione-specific gamma-glutamylcyclotransferase n=1 Tax=Dibothriocephalus latus TaxID=60516 RepID=A0A3P7NZT8_DIBLA|nr:unnamed protein product [Dibothriocephalus latus]
MESVPSELPHTRKVSFLRSQMVNPRTGKLYIFGYGSLIWKPNITYSRSWVGYIEGYHRRFYQGTTTHRGTPEWPGRVATLVPARNAHTRVWGVTYEIQGRRDIDAALEHLAEREMITGGYRFDEVDFVARKLTFATADSPEDEWSKDLTAESARLSVQVYIAEPGNPQYIGDAPLEVQEVPKEDLLFEKYLLDLNQLVEDYRSHRKSLPNGFSSEAARMSIDGSFNSSNDISLEKSNNQRSDAFPSLRRQFSAPTRDNRRRGEKVRPVEVRVKAS